LFLVNVLLLIRLFLVESEAKVRLGKKEKEGRTVRKRRKEEERRKKKEPLTCLSLFSFLFLFFKFYKYTCGFFFSFLIKKYTVGMTRRIDQVKIGVLQKGVNMGGHNCHFF
jgi:hypothetical protein